MLTYHKTDNRLAISNYINSERLIQVGYSPNLEMKISIEYYIYGRFGGDFQIETYKVYHDNDKIYPLADELVNSFSKFLESKGILFFNDDSDEYQMKNRHAIYGEDFRVLREMIQIVLDNRIVIE